MPVDWLQAIQCYDLNEPFHVRIGAVAGSYYPRKIPAAMADKKLLSMKVKTETGEVEVVHGVPHTLAALVYCDKDEKSAWDMGLKMSKKAMEQANKVAQTGEKPANYLNSNMLVELDSLQELCLKDQNNQVFRIFIC